MATTYDTVIVGAGHNGLACAAYLARAGRRVLVLERRKMLGGRAVTEEFAPGFRCSATFANAETFDPTIAADLELATHGLQLLPASGILVPRQKEQALFLSPPNGSGTHQTEVRGCPAADAEALLAFDGFLRRLAEALIPNPIQAPPGSRTVGPRRHSRASGNRLVTTQVGQARSPRSDALSAHANRRRTR